eukprot:UN21138
MIALPDAGLRINSRYREMSPRLDYEIDVAVAGEYYVWILGLGDSETEGDSDSLHVGRNGLENGTSDRMTGFNTTASWSRDTMDDEPATLMLDEGLNTLNTWMREDGLFIDHFVLTRDADFVPENNNPCDLGPIPPSSSSSSSSSGSGSGGGP